jgi:hypothetical protein
MLIQHAQRINDFWNQASAKRVQCLGPIKLYMHASAIAYTWGEGRGGMGRIMIKRKKGNIAISYLNNPNLALDLKLDILVLSH